jgi:ribose 5-phosphate isomerase B
MFSAHQGVEDDDMNIMCIGGRVVGFELAKDLVNEFLKACFKGDERFRRRLWKVTRLEMREEAHEDKSVKNVGVLRPECLA